MTQYIIRRLLLMIPTLLGVSLLVTAFVRMLPGDAVDILTANNEIRAATRSSRNPSVRYWSKRERIR